MSYEKRDGDIILFANDQKGNDQAPVMRGFIQVNGEEHEVALWSKRSAKGTRFWSGNAKPKQAREDRPQRQPEAEFTDEIPF